VAGQIVFNGVSVWDYSFGPNGQNSSQPAAWLIVSSEETQYSTAMKPVWKQRGPRYDRETGVAWTATYSVDGRLDTETGEDGVVLRYEYDAVGRVIRKTLKGQTSPTYNSVTLTAIPDRVLEYRIDAAGQVVEEKVVGASESLVTNHVFDKAGRKTQTRVPGPSGQITTSIGYQVLGTGGLQITSTAPDGGSTIKKTHRDGKTSADEGTAQVNKAWAYQIGTDGRLTTTAAEGPRWSSATADWLGRTVATTRPTQAGGTYVETQDYNSAGQLVATSNNFPGSRAIRHVYGALGEKIREGVDMDGNGALDLASSDRITETETKIGFVMSGSWPNYLPSRSERITEIRYYGTPGNATPTVLRQTRQKLGWWYLHEHAWESTTGDVGVSERQSVRNGTCKVTTSTGARTEVAVEAAGKTLRTIKGPVTTTFQYDDCDRLVTQTDARKGDTEFTYFANSATPSAMIDPADLAASRITEVYHFNAAGRRVATVDALSQTRRVDYDLHGRVVREWGSASYPVERIYSSCGRIAELRTYRGGTGWDGATWPTATAGTFDKTTWTYGTATGLLLAKTDANNASVTYAYDTAGRTTSRTWARGVVTTYNYDAGTGDLLSTSYSDSTPSVTYTYDRRGRTATVLDGVGSRTLSYSAYDQLTMDALVMTGFGTGTVTYTYDAYTRRASLGFNIAPTAGSAFGQYRPYSYVAGTGLLASIGYSNGGTYTYLPNSALPASIDAGGNSLTSELSWAPHRDELVAYDNRYSGGMLSAHRFDYARDSTSRITQETQTILDGQTVTNRTFSYNSRSELTSDAGSGLSYDAQGNRTTGYGAAYQANALNQYTTVAGVSWTYDADGNPLSNGIRSYVYDAENRLVQAGTHTFSYDYRHRLVKAVGPAWPSSSPPITSWRLYDGHKVVLREDSGVGCNTLRAEYVWGLDLAGRSAGGDGTGALLAVISDGVGYVPHYDGRGNIWRFTGGTLRSMNVFGDVAFVNYYPPALIETTLLSLAHGSKEFFYGLGLYNYGRRFYDPKNGRFIGRDPIQEEGGTNLYRFNANNPVNRWDFNGLLSFESGLAMEMDGGGFGKPIELPRVEVKASRIKSSAVSGTLGDLLGVQFHPPGLTLEIALAFDQYRTTVLNHLCKEQAAAEHIAAVSKLVSLRNVQIASYFGSYAANQAVETADTNIGIAINVVYASGATFVGLATGGSVYFIAVSPVASLAATYPLLGSEAAVLSAGAQVATLQLRANILGAISGAAGAFGTSVLLDSDPDAIALAGGSGALDLVAQGISPAGYVAAIAPGAVQLLEQSGLSVEAAISRIAEIDNTIARTHQSLSDQYREKVAGCDEMYK